MGNAASRSIRSVIDDFPPLDRKPLKKLSGQPGLPAFLGLEPEVSIEDLQLIKVDTREGFHVFCQVFAAWRPAQLRDDVRRHSRGADLEAAVKLFAANKEPSLLQEEVHEDSAQRLRRLPSLRSPPLPVAPATITYLRRLAAAAARDRSFQAACATSTADFPALAPPEPVKPRGVSVQSPDAAEGASSDTSEYGEVEDGGVEDCMLCGEPAVASSSGSGGEGGGAVPCECSLGHPVCGTCLRQYVLHTHGLQAGLTTLKCLAFDDEAAATGRGARRCQGRYSEATLQGALKPTELLAIRTADQLALQRRLDRSSIPLSCVKCGHGDRISRHVLERAAGRPRVVRHYRMLRVAGVPLVPARRSHLTPPAIRCTNRRCKASYCCNCGGLHHRSAVCSPDPQDTTFMQWVSGRRKQVQGCPKCGMVIEKHGGCKYMLCPRSSGGCGHEFCWLCRGTYLGLHKCGKMTQDYEE